MASEKITAMIEEVKTSGRAETPNTSLMTQAS